MGIKFTNNAEGTLTAGVAAGDTTNMALTAGDSLLFPTIVAASGDFFYATLVDSSGNVEIVKVTEHQAGTNIFQAFTRAQDDTAATAFAIGDKVQLRLPKIILEDYRDDITANTALIASEDAILAARIATNETDLAGTTNAGSVPAPSGTKMYFYQDTVPTNWTIDTGPADALLGIKGGAQAFNAAGGTVVGTWTPTNHTHTGPSHTHTGPSHTHTGPSHTHTGPSHTHTIAHTHTYSGTTSTWNTGMQDQGSGSNNCAPAHAHTYSGTTSASSAANSGAGGTGATSAAGTGATGADGTGATGADGTGATGGSGSPSTDRPQTAIGSMGTKD